MSRNSRNMHHGQLKIRKGIYRDRIGAFDNKKTISEFSVRHGTVHLDRRNARYLVEENIKDDVKFDLKLGLREYYEESDEEDSEESEEGAGVEESEESCCTFSEWACLQPQQTLKEVFGGADFVGYRTSFRDIAKTVITHRRFHDKSERQPIQCKDADDVVFHTRHVNPPIKPWARVAMRAGDVIIIRDASACPFLDDSEEEEDDDIDEDEEENEEEENVEEDDRTDGERIVDIINDKLHDEIRQQMYSGFKFQQYMTSEEPHGQATPEKRMRVRSFETVMTGDLLDEFRPPFRLCCFAECDALKGDEPIELKSTYSEGFFSKVHTFLHCNFANMETLVTGQRNEDWITTRVFERKVSQLLNDFAPMSEGDSRADEQCYAFLFDVLEMTKNVLRTAKACRFVYMPKTGMIQFEPITVKEATKRGHGFTRQFKERFGISD